MTQSSNRIFSMPNRHFCTGGCPRLLLPLLLLRLLPLGGI